MFFVHQLSVKIKISLFFKFWLNLVCFDLEIREFSYFNQIMLILFDVLNVFGGNIKANKCQTI